jgi:AcrR family transcriptional regulator
VPRKMPTTRFDDLVRNATEVFIAQGYRRTQMADVAAAIGVSKATLYLYVESKEALFWLCLLHVVSDRPVERPDVIPVSGPASGTIGAQLKERLSREVALSSLERAERVARAPDISHELAEIVGEYYDLNLRFRRGIKLIDRSRDHPEISSVWQEGGRESMRRRLSRYLATRMDAGQIRRGDPRLDARFIIEVVATWAVHIHWDHQPEHFDASAVRQKVIESQVAALVAPSLR